MVNEFEGINSDAVSSDNFPPSVPKVFPFLFCICTGIGIMF